MGENARYNKIRWNYWIRSLGWSDDSKLLGLYILTCKHTNIFGCYYLPFGYIYDDLGWSAERLGKPFEELLVNGFIKYDQNARVIWAVEWFDHNTIDNPNQVIAALGQLKEMPKSSLFSDVCDRLEQLGKPFLQPLIKQLAYTITITIAITKTIDDHVALSVPETAAQILNGIEQVGTTQEEEPPIEEPKGKKTKAYKFNEEQMRLAEFLKDLILQVKPNAKIPDKLDKWADCARLMIENDKRTAVDIARVMKWAKLGSSFWPPNVLSMDSVREHYDQIEGEMKQKGVLKIGTTNQAGGAITGSDQGDRFAGIAKNGGE
jgi:hypothetical protein